MANIGTFTAEKDGFTGQLRTDPERQGQAGSQRQGRQRERPRLPPSGGRPRIGAAWKKTSEAGREYLSVSIDDPSFPATVYARLIENEDGTHDPDLVAQQAQGSLTAAHRAPSIAAGRRATGAARHARLRRVAFLQHRLQLTAHLRQKLIGLRVLSPA